jgi:hypothetical protein
MVIKIGITGYPRCGCGYEEIIVATTGCTPLPYLLVGNPVT